MAHRASFVALLATLAGTAACCGQPENTRVEFSPDEALLIEALADGELTQFECQSLCGIDVPDTADTGFRHDADRLLCDVVRENEERVIVKCNPLHYCKGRFSDGLADETVRARTSLGAWFAHAAWSERASIASFRRLRRELHAHGAPIALVRAASRGARDEIRHGQAMARLAARLGATVPPVRVDHGPVRPLVDVLRENAVEGCARETVAAVTAEFQALRARGVGLRTVFARIARDERRHARLAWQVHRWGRARLDERGRAQVDGDLRAAFADLAAAHPGDPVEPAAVAVVVGAPDAEQRRALALATSRALGQRKP